QAEVALRLGVLRLDGDHPVEVDRRLGMVAHAQLDQAEVEPQRRVVGMLAGQLDVHRARLLIAARAELQEAAQVARAQIVGPQLERGGDLAIGAVELLGAQQLARLSEVLGQTALDVVWLTRRDRLIHAWRTYPARRGRSSAALGPI